MQWRQQALARSRAHSDPPRRQTCRPRPAPLPRRRPRPPLSPWLLASRCPAAAPRCQTAAAPAGTPRGRRRPPPPAQAGAADGNQTSGRGRQAGRQAGRQVEGASAAGKGRPCPRLCSRAALTSESMGSAPRPRPAPSGAAAAAASSGSSSSSGAETYSISTSSSPSCTGAGRAPHQPCSPLARGTAPVARPGGMRVAEPASRAACLELAALVWLVLLG